VQTKSDICFYTHLPSNIPNIIKILRHILQTVAYTKKGSNTKTRKPVNFSYSCIEALFGSLCDRWYISRESKAHQTIQCTLWSRGQLKK
jgi:hypothetical protein